MDLDRCRVALDDVAPLLRFSAQDVRWSGGSAGVGRRDDISAPASGDSRAKKNTDSAEMTATARKAGGKSAACSAAWP